MTCSRVRFTFIIYIWTSFFCTSCAIRAITGNNNKQFSNVIHNIGCQGTGVFARYNKMSSQRNACRHKYGAHQLLKLLRRSVSSLAGKQLLFPPYFKCTRRHRTASCWLSDTGPDRLYGLGMPRMNWVPDVKAAGA